MGGEITLKEALDQVESSLVKTRKEGIENLTHILRHNQRQSGASLLDDASYHHVYEVLFRLVVAEQSAWLKGSTKTAVSSTERRLSDLATALRLAVEIGAAHVKGKTVKALLDHVIQTLPLSGGGICLPLALDYTRAFNAILSFTPHIEHLPRAEWSRVVQFCVDLVTQCTADLPEDGAVGGAENVSISRTVNGSSYRSSRSQVKESSASQTERTLTKQVIGEIVTSLDLLTSAPNAPVGSKGSAVLWTVIDHLKHAQLANRVPQKAFSTINHILAWSRTENITLTKQGASHMIRLAAAHWGRVQKTFDLRDELCIMLLYLRPYLEHLMHTDQALTLRGELSGLADVLRSDYYERFERDQLQVDHLRLAIVPELSEGARHIGTAIFELQPGNFPADPRSPNSHAEHKWTVVSVLATLVEMLSYGVEVSRVSGAEDDRPRPHKRQRTSNEYQEVIAATRVGPSSSRIGALQVVAVYAQQALVTVEMMSEAIDALSSSCADDNTTVSSWALLALASCASQTNASDDALTDRWGNIWQLAGRAMTNAATSRAACHLLHLMLRLELGQHGAATDFMHTLSESIDLGGPATLSDAGMQLLARIIERSLDLRRSSASKLAEGGLNWLLKGFAPGRLTDRVHLFALRQTFEVNDVVQLICVCLNLCSPRPTLTPLPVYDSVGQAWTLCQDTYPMISYLLLGQSITKATNPRLQDLPVTAEQHQTMVRPGRENWLLSYLLSELRSMRAIWDEHLGTGRGSLDAYSSAFDSCYFMAIVAHDLTFQDVRRQQQIQQELKGLLTAISTVGQSTSCGQGVIDAIIQAYSRACVPLMPHIRSREAKSSEAEKILGCHLANILSVRRRLLQSTDAFQDEEPMEIDDDYDSQGSRAARRADTLIQSRLQSYAAVEYSNYAVRANVELWSIATRDTHQHLLSNDPSSRPASVTVREYILSLPPETVIAGHAAIAALPRIGLRFDLADTEMMFESWSESMLAAYDRRRSEPALTALLNMAQSVLPALSDSSNRSLFGLGVDIYDYYIEAQGSGVLSMHVQIRLASLVLQLCNIDPDYGRDQDVQSARTSLFKLLKCNNFKVLYHMTGGIASIFSRFVLSKHESVFDDLHDNLPIDADWLEGLAVRLLFLSRLASAWHSLRRQCVYYMFETAGRIPDAAPYAARCFKELATALGYASCQTLFRLFAPQLLHTWLEERTVNGLPYAAFEYASLTQLLERNRSETVAQLLARGKDDGMHVVTTSLKTTAKELARQSFAQSAAYAISWDISPSSEHSGGATSEGRLRNLVGGKEEYRKLATDHFPAIMGHFYLSLQLDDGDKEDKWLEKKASFTAEAKAIAEMKTYGHSPRTLPPGQQPSFKIKFLPEQIERLCRRTSRDPAQPWDCSSFTLTARMITDAMDDALGPLHVCMMLRKMRILIAMAGDVALSGYPLQMLMHSVRAFLSVSECADDVLGIVQYLLQRGQHYLKQPEAISFACGIVTLMVLQMRQHSITRHESTTQESQHKDTVRSMEKFHAWLVKYLQQLRSTYSSPRKGRFDELVEALRAVNLPGNGRKGTPESKLLLLLLAEMQSVDGIMSSAHCKEALAALTNSFEPSHSTDEDCLSEDSGCIFYVDALWHLLGTHEPSNGFATWSAQVMGRAYAAQGRRPYPLKSPQNLQSTHKNALNNALAYSEAEIGRRLSELVFTSERDVAGLAEWTLRRIQYTFESGDDALRFEQALPHSLTPAIADGTYGYQPYLSEIFLATPLQLSTALEMRPSYASSAWILSLATALCQSSPKAAILPTLPPILQRVSGLAADLLPAVAHILLVHEINTVQKLKTQLSQSISDHLMARDAALLSRQCSLIQLLLYLRRQPYPGEATRVDRLQWLDVDLLVSAEAATRCGMGTAALMFAESALPTAPPNRRTSSRASLSQFQHVDISDELLLRIFKQIDEPDSFYGVQQPATLDSVLDRLDYEGAGYKGLMLHAAKLDSVMRMQHQALSTDTTGLMRSLSTLNLHSLQLALVSSRTTSTEHTAPDVFRAAQKLQQWDLTIPEASGGDQATCFTCFQDLSRATNPEQLRKRLDGLLLQHVTKHRDVTHAASPPWSWCNTLATIVGTAEVIRSPGDGALRAVTDRMSSRHDWLRHARFEDVNDFAVSHSSLLSVLAQNPTLLREMHLSPKKMKLLEISSQLEYAKLAQGHDFLQEALSAVAQVKVLAAQAEELGLQVSAATQRQTASALWATGEAAASVQFLKGILRTNDSDSQDIPVGQAGLQAILASQLAQARLERPEEILSNHLQSAIKDLRGRAEGVEAGEVFFQFASFCDGQLQSPAVTEDLDRLEVLRQKKKLEAERLRKLQKEMKNTDDRNDFNRQAGRAEQWYAIYSEEQQRLRRSRDEFMQQSLQNYMLALRASDDHDISVLRFFAMWFENADSPVANPVVAKHLSEVPSWKFAVLNNQLMSRLEYTDLSSFQSSLRGLVQRLCAEHPYHTLHHLYATTREPEQPNDEAAQSRYRAAQRIRNALQTLPDTGDLVKKVFRADNEYNRFAQSPNNGSNVSKIAIADFPPAARLTSNIRNLRVPPATVSVPLRPDGRYHDVPEVAGFAPEMRIMGGQSHPKLLIARGTDGKVYRELFKFNDDLRQDAIMEQVFGEVSKMLSKHKDTRRRNLTVRTYKVIPLAPRSGIIEFVANSIAIGDYLKPAHQKYYPSGMKPSVAADKIRSVERMSQDARVKEYRKVCEQIPPVLRFFFFENFEEPDEWFTKRTAYTRTTAAISILGYVLGVGDRHIQNILLDANSGEVVHIDLGIAFEAGRVLPVPEMVPFRLTRDVVDGMGITKTEGVFRRCCEFTMDALREDKGSIMTLLNVLRYDPLVSWTVSSGKAKKMQDAQETGRNGIGVDVPSSERKEHGAAEGDRALGIVETKLSTTLSTAATVNELIQQASDEKNLATLFCGWSAYY
ncbi:hypothetical protein BAUCODRAFT_31809 [Baudoinia panamericana UAMH 10762]|uniref:Serine/threonine-protein kinase Tel1 n=1 Tax=Baudoinia panamericana (strain UAMH 10762) TaxID=717646 RepID=M2NEW7_BAUPA|nr:uncharacterized protein BAUCODRAFT_31809 [Baudoinia panamericana UAMH 10762]EMC97804.1 hypothetical protein BAUCODRAFT_31809 [Baudoinia panamericana UAMH 10762]